jgi:hypothetical protein
MKSTRNRKAKRGKTRRTRRKARTTHTGGGGGIKWKFWEKDNTVVPEPTINFGDLISLLHRNGYTNTVNCLRKERVNKDKSRIDKPIYLCDAPCDSNPEPVAPITQSQAGLPLSTERPIESINVLTEENPNPNGWYIEVETTRDWTITSIQNAGLTNTDSKKGNINNFGNSNFDKYMDTINNLPNPSYSYSTDIEGVIHTLSLRSNDGGSYLLWVDSKNNHIMYGYNTEKPLTISINGKECTLTKVE